jgi:hypothetical protein
MTENRRQYPRYEIELDARIYATDLELSVAVVDISEGGLGIISEKPIEIGTKVSLQIDAISEASVIGFAVWGSIYGMKGKKYYYRIGIETENLSLEMLKTLGFPKRSKYLSEINSHIEKNGF